MLKINKIAIGIRPSTKMFRISSLGGLIIDSILALRGNKIDDEYYKEVIKDQLTGALGLQNIDNGNRFHVDSDNIVFTKDVYENGKHIDLKKMIDEIQPVWDVVNDLLKITDIRRIGIVAEHQIEITETAASKKLFQKFTSIDSFSHPAKFALTYEDRQAIEEGSAPDVKKSDFINIIYNYYDSTDDKEYPKEGFINANIDVQRYYSPLLKKNVIHEIKKTKATFLDKKKQFDADLKKRGFIA